MCQNFSKYHDYLVSTTHIFFFKRHVVLCHCPQLFPPFTVILCQLFPPSPTLPLHTPISLILSLFCFLPINSQFNLFILNEFLSVLLLSIKSANFHEVHNSICMPYSSLCSCFFSFHFSLYICSKHHHHTKNRYSPTANIIDYLDPGTMPQQNSTVIISTTVMDTVSSSQLTNHPFIPG